MKTNRLGFDIEVTPELEAKFQFERNVWTEVKKEPNNPTYIKHYLEDLLGKLPKGNPQQPYKNIEMIDLVLGKDEEDTYRKLAFSMIRTILHHDQFPAIRPRMSTLEFEDKDNEVFCRMQIRH